MRTATLSRLTTLSNLILRLSKDFDAFYIDIPSVSDQVYQRNRAESYMQLLMDSNSHMGCCHYLINDVLHIFKSMPGSDYALTLAMELLRFV